MYSLKFAVFITLTLLNNLEAGRIPLENSTPTEELETSSKRENVALNDPQKGQDDVSELLNLILETVTLPAFESRPNRLVDEVAAGPDSLKAFVLSMAPDRRKELSEALRKAVNSDGRGSFIPTEETSQGNIASQKQKELRMYTMPADHKVQDFMNLMLKRDLNNSIFESTLQTEKEDSETPVTVQDLKDLVLDTINKQKIFSGIYRNSLNEDSDKKTVDRFVSGLLNSRFALRNFA